MIMIVKTPESQMGSPAVAEEGGEAMRGGRGESGESCEVHERPSVTSTAPKAPFLGSTHVRLRTIARFWRIVFFLLPSLFCCTTLTI